jgi:hypothetical protein
VTRALVLFALAACGDNVPAPADAASVICSAAFAGNYSEQSHGADDCALLAADGTLALHVPVATLNSKLEISIALGATPTIGKLSSETVSTWSATIDSRCVYAAGASSVPMGSFELTLDSVDPIHGTLAITQYLQMFPGTPYCGPDDNELVTLTF